MISTEEGDKPADELRMALKSGPGYDAGSHWALQDVEAVKGSVCSSAAGAVIYESGNEKDEQWVQGQDLLGLDCVIEDLLPLSARKLRKPTGGTCPPPLQVLRQVKKDFGTNVLATVYCPAWRVNWMRANTLLIIESYAMCHELVLMAIKGGPNTDCEIRYLEELMPRLGFTTRSFRDVCSGYFQWIWTIHRPGAQEYQVTLNQYSSPRCIPGGKIAWDTRANKDHAQPPNLQRLCVVSSPLLGKSKHGEPGEPVHDMLNIKLIEGMDEAAKDAEKKYKPESWDEN